MGKHKKKGGGSKSQDQNKIIAVLCPFVFGNGFYPYDDDFHVARLPFLNATILEYTIETLAAGGVDEIHILTYPRLSSVINNLQLKQLRSKVMLYSSITINAIEVPFEIENFAKAMQIVANQPFARTKNDIIVVDGLIIGSGLDFRQLHSQHYAMRKRFEKMKDVKQKLQLSIMLTQRSYGHPLRFENTHVRYCVNHQNIILDLVNANEKLVGLRPLHFQETYSHDPEQRIRVLSDCCSTGIYIFSPSGLSKWNDDFSYSKTLFDFVRYFIDNKAVMGDVCHATVLPSTVMVAKLTNWPSLFNSSVAFLRRFFYPMVPETFLKNVRCSMAHVYLGRDTRFSMEKVGYPLFAGDYCEVGLNSFITNSILGDNVKIGDNCHIVNCIIATDVVIHSNVHLRNCVVLHGAQVHNAHAVKDAPITLHGLIVDVNSTCGFSRSLPENYHGVVLSQDKINSSGYDRFISPLALNSSKQEVLASEFLPLANFLNENVELLDFFYDPTCVIHRDTTVETVEEMWDRVKNLVFERIFMADSVPFTDDHFMQLSREIDNVVQAHADISHADIFMELVPVFVDLSIIRFMQSFPKDVLPGVDHSIKEIVIHFQQCVTQHRRVLGHCFNAHNEGEDVLFDSTENMLITLADYLFGADDEWATLDVLPSLSYAERFPSLFKQFLSRTDVQEQELFLEVLSNLRKMLVLVIYKLKQEKLAVLDGVQLWYENLDENDELEIEIKNIFDSNAGPNMFGVEVDEEDYYSYYDEEEEEFAIIDDDTESTKVMIAQPDSDSEDENIDPELLAKMQDFRVDSIDIQLTQSVELDEITYDDETLADDEFEE
ncbi:hypothetical protein PCE1_004531 [Barthelona sp. PCE]